MLSTMFRPSQAMILSALLWQQAGAQNATPAVSPNSTMADSPVTLPKQGAPPEEAWLPGRLQWFQDQKFGFMMHWEPYSQWGCIESWPLVEEDKWARPDDLKPFCDNKTSGCMAKILPTKRLTKAPP